jgi:hypothetical protein
MIAGPYEQRNPYKGFPDRPWIRLRLTASDGTGEEMELLADTGNPCGQLSQDWPDYHCFAWPNTAVMQTGFGFDESKASRKHPRLAYGTLRWSKIRWSKFSDVISSASAS